MLFRSVVRVFSDAAARSSASSRSLAALAFAINFRSGFHKQPWRYLLLALSLSGYHHFPDVASSARQALSTASPLVRTQSSDSKNAMACHCTYVLKSQPHFIVRASVSSRMEYSMFSNEVMNSLSFVSWGKLAPCNTSAKRLHRT